MVKNIIVTLVMLFVAESAMAFCNLERLPFGEGAKSVATRYNHTQDPVEEVFNGSTFFLVNGSDVCKEFAQSATVELFFIDNKLSQFTIYNKKSDGSILKIAEDNFGEAKGKKNPSHPNADTFESVWNEDKNLSVTYATKPSGKDMFEYLRIVSKKYEDLFSKVAKDQETKSEQSDSKENAKVEFPKSNGK